MAELNIVMMIMLVNDTDYIASYYVLLAILLMRMMLQLMMMMMMMMLVMTMILVMMMMMMLANDRDYIDLLGSARAAKLQTNHLYADSTLPVLAVQMQIQLHVTIQLQIPIQIQIKQSAHTRVYTTHL